MSSSGSTRACRTISAMRSRIAAPRMSAIFYGRGSVAAEQRHRTSDVSPAAAGDQRSAPRGSERTGRPHLPAADLDEQLAVQVGHLRHPEQTHIAIDLFA